MFMSMSKKKIILTSSEGDRFELDEKVVVEMRTIEHLIDVKRELAMTTTATSPHMADDFVYAPIEVSRVSSKILSTVIEYCQKHTDDKYETRESLKSFDPKLVNVDQNTLFDLMVAADSLGITSLVDLSMSQICKGKSKKEICNLFFDLFN